MTKCSSPSSTDTALVFNVSWLRCLLPSAPPLLRCATVVCLTAFCCPAMSSLTSADIHKMKVADLKSALKERGLDASGVKADLIARLEQHSQTKPTTVASPAGPAALAKSPSSHSTTQHKAAQTPTAAATQSAASAVTAPPTASITAAPAAASSTATDASSATAAGGPSPSLSSSSPSSSSPLDTELAARQRRADKFGTTVQPPSDEVKRKLREERFGPVVQKAADNKKQKVSNQQSTAAASTAATPATSTAATTAAPASKAKAQNGQKKAGGAGAAAAPAAAAVVDPVEEEKRKARAARFAAQTAA